MVHEVSLLMGTEVGKSENGLRGYGLGSRLPGQSLCSEAQMETVSTTEALNIGFHQFCERSRWSQRVR